ncbi:MAG: GNAT family N-acetyltransferase [bacterium]
MAVVVKPVESASERRLFAAFPRQVYRNEPYWIPPLASEVRSLIHSGNHPFHEHADIGLFLARNEGRIVGRIAACVNHTFNEFHKQRVAVFGLFEALPEYEYAAALFRRAATWATERGMTILRGPMSFSTNEDCGLLAEGFDSYPCIMMPYNPPHYTQFVERFGFTGVRDLLAFVIESQEIPTRLEEGAQAVLRRTRAKVRPINFDEFDQETALLHDLYGDAWSDNWGYSPIPLEEFRWRAEKLKKLVDPELVPILEVNGEAVGFAAILPDINEILHPVKKWPAFTHLPWLLVRWRAIRGVRVLMMGIRKSHRRLGLDSVLYWTIYRTCLARGVERAELSWVLDNNDPLLNAFRYLNARQSKVYRLYDYPLDGQTPPHQDPDE